jgi:hypothetical protein
LTGVSVIAKSHKAIKHQKIKPDVLALDQRGDISLFIFCSQDVVGQSIRQNT